MRKAERLFQIIQILRRSSRPVTSAEIAEELEVARRTVYRDIADLIGQRVPITGEAGFGYVIDAQYDMPPLMLTPEEIEAAMLGAQMVARLGDPALTNAASDLIAKISTTIPPALLPFIAEPAVGMRPADIPAEIAIDTRPIRQAIREGRKIALEYRAGSGETTRRMIWPVILGYADSYRLLIGWCELRKGFRHFRADRIVRLDVMEEPIAMPRQKLVRQWQQWRASELSRGRRP
ncbi:YafY family protein [Neorhizobium sp. NCHU2750]|uniref:helix-turn-helix transcriptional regulator n=1 Tax=Neorhizobium sp. NCHU2750 TaxID=1825976 RepID=UPI000E74E5DE|nr:DNA-binding protein [Neorhizobium sp. NCHU2750]